MEVCLENKPEPEVDGGGEAFEPSNIRKGYYNQAMKGMVVDQSPQQIRKLA
jgi:hypothetical protein